MQQYEDRKLECKFVVLVEVWVFICLSTKPDMDFMTESELLLLSNQLLYLLKFSFSFSFFLENSLCECEYYNY